MKSGARKFCEVAWEQFRPTARSVAWCSSVLATDQARHAIISWALDLGAQWNDGDLKAMPFLWAHEGHYSNACGKGNTSFCRAYEKRRGREPFLYVADPERKTSRERLHVGSEFIYKGVMLDLTSFADDGSYINAIAYPRHGLRGNKIKDTVEGQDLRGADQLKGTKRFKLTIEDLRVHENEVMGPHKARKDDLRPLMSKHGISVEDAHEVWKHVAGCRLAKCGASAAGGVAGPFQFTIASDGHLRIGCESFDYSRLERFAKMMGWVTA